MELSICIPVYQQNVEKLCAQLLSQLKRLTIDGDIVIIDDGSDEKNKEQNRKLRKQEHIVYEELPENIGRAAIRNLLASKAQGRYLIFLDDDSKIHSATFLSEYLKYANPQTVVCGGRRYSFEEPDTGYELHYRYGISSESRLASKRSTIPYQSFHTNNFLIDRDTFLEIKFDETLTGYGHEDTLFGYRLKKKGVPIVHIDNQVIHGRLESNAEFLEKTREGLNNLYKLYQNQQSDFARSVKLLRAFDSLVRSGTHNVMAHYFNRVKFRWERRLTESGRPSIRLLNLYKLGYLCELHS